MQNKYINGILLSAEYFKTKGELSITYFNILRNAMRTSQLDKATYARCLAYTNLFLKGERQI